jgi:hypothetical protein
VLLQFLFRELLPLLFTRLKSLTFINLLLLITPISHVKKRYIYIKFIAVRVEILECM